MNTKRERERCTHLVSDTCSKIAGNAVMGGKILIDKGETQCKLQILTYQAPNKLAVKMELWFDYSFKLSALDKKITQGTLYTHSRPCLKMNIKCLFSRIGKLLLHVLIGRGFLSFEIVMLNIFNFD